eukprot:COSAG02_NODE_6006_length_3880_cov_2.898440_3_plen_85_part_00
MATATTTTTVHCSDGFIHTVESSPAATARRRLEAVLAGTSVPSGPRLLHTVFAPLGNFVLNQAIFHHLTTRLVGAGREHIGDPA